MADWISRATLDIIGVAGVGQNFNALHDHDSILNTAYRRAFNTADDATVVAFLETMENLILVSMLGHLPLKRNVEVQAAVKVVREVSKKVVEGRPSQGALCADESSKDVLATALQSGTFSDETWWIR